MKSSGTRVLLVGLAIAASLIFTVGASGNGSVTYSITLESIDTQPDLQHYGIAHFLVTFSDGKFHQCCDRVQVVTTCENGYTEGGGPAKTLWYTTPTPMIGPYYLYNMVPTVCHSWVERLVNHNKRSGVASNIVTYAAT